MTLYLPLITAQNQNFMADDQIRRSSFVGSVSDPNGLSITELAFRDEGGDGGYFVLNGAAQPDGEWIFVTASKLTSFVYQAGSSHGSEEIDLADWDCYNWSDYAAATETSYALPVMTARSETALQDQTIGASSFIASVSGPNGLQITEYGFRDEGGDGGRFVLNGVVQQPDGMRIDVSAPQFRTFPTSEPLMQAARRSMSSHRIRGAPAGGAWGAPGVGSPS